MTMRHKTTGPVQGQTRNPRGGVALIMTLGLLAVLTLLAVAFSIAMRVESLAARNYANLVRARHLVQTSLARAVDDINSTCAGATYPTWDVLASGWDGGALTNICAFLSGEATNAIAGALMSDAEAATAYWRNVIVTNSGGTVQTNGRIAYLAVNTSGLLDANLVGGSPRTASTKISEIDISRMIPDVTGFLTQRTAHRRYETIQELYGINTAADAYFASNFTVFSHDPDRDVYFVDTNELGSATAELKKKFNINAITNYAGYSAGAGAAPDVYSGDAAFMANYWTPLRDMLAAAGLERPDDVAWNVVNYLDPDRYPRGVETFSYRHTEGGEANPMINEIVYRRKPTAAPDDRVYQFAVEVWFPFAPVVVEPDDGYWLQVAVFTNNFVGSAPTEANIMNFRYLPFSTNVPLASMTFGDTNEFRVITTPDIRFPVLSPTNGAAGDAFPLWFLARVIKNASGMGAAPDTSILSVVDEAMGYQQSDENSPDVLHRRSLRRFTTPRGYAINDPRSNGQCRYWDPAMPGAGTTAADAGIAYDLADIPGATSSLMTLGTTNIVTGTLGAWDNYKSQGLPIWWKDGPMRNIAELGHIYRNNLDDEMPFGYRFWRNIDLMNKNEGAALLDWMTVRPTNAVISTKGLVSINTRQFETLYNLFHGLIIGTTNVVYTGTNLVDSAAISNLVDTIIYNGPYVSFRDMFQSGVPGVPTSPGSDGGPVAVAFRQCVDDGLWKTNDILYEDTFRAIAELITFRQNMFTILVAGQSLGRNGRTVVGEQRAVATIIRDSYTGRYFVRNFKWLTD